MDDLEFWRIISLFNWKKAGDDEAVLRPAIKELSKKPVHEIAGFEEILSQKLHSLDTRAHAQSIGNDRYIDEKHTFSVDWFLYCRCCVVANGPAVYANVLAEPSSFPKDMEFEALLGIARDAYQLKTGQESDGFETTISYETFSNTSGWAAA